MMKCVERVVELLEAKGDLLATAESCTGGRLAASFTSIRGASSWYLGGWVTYSNAMKTNQLGVPAEMLEVHGAVSSQVAIAMCEGAAKNCGATVALSTTGIAGPTGGTDEKPVGTVFIGCTTKNGTQVKRCLFSGAREEVQDQATREAVQLLSEAIV